MTIRIVRMGDVHPAYVSPVVSWLWENGVTHLVPLDAVLELRHGKTFTIDTHPYRWTSLRPWASTMSRPHLAADEQYRREHGDLPRRPRTFRQRTPFPTYRPTHNENGAAA